MKFLSMIEYFENTVRFQEDRVVIVNMRIPTLDYNNFPTGNKKASHRILISYFSFHKLIRTLEVNIHIFNLTVTILFLLKISLIQTNLKNNQSEEKRNHR